MAKASDFAGKKDDELFYLVDYSPEEAERIGYSNYSYWGSVVKNFLKNKIAVFCMIVFLVLVIFSFVALAIGKYSYEELVPYSSTSFQSPNGEFWFGTDNLGQDYWCQVWYATQVSIRLALIVAVGECIVGVIFGLIWGYVRKLDRLFTEIYNLLDSVPYNHLYDPDRPDGGPELYHHGGVDDLHRLVPDGAPGAQHGVHVPRPGV